LQSQAAWNLALVSGLGLPVRRISNETHCEPGHQPILDQSAQPSNRVLKVAGRQTASALGGGRASMTHSDLGLGPQPPARPTICIEAAGCWQPLAEAAARGLHMREAWSLDLIQKGFASITA